jgi:iron only hydrogenase large subunit-like protein
MSKKSVGNLNFPLRGKYVAMVAPSFVVDFSYPGIIYSLKKLGFDKVVELTFGAKMINRDYHKKLCTSRELLISSACPGVVQTIKEKFPEYEPFIANIDSPMVAMGKVCRKTYPKHKIVFISPCHFKKTEAENSKYVDYTIDYLELKELFRKMKINLDKMPKDRKFQFDKFYNDYTKIFPLSGGLYKTAHLKKVVGKKETLIADGISDVIKFLEKPKKKIIFLDVTFCRGGCIGGPCVSNKLSLKKRKKKIIRYLKDSRYEDIPESKKGLVDKAKGLVFRKILGRK